MTDEPETFGLTGEEVRLLATFNAERHRGLVHTPEYSERMDELQRRFDGRLRAEWIAMGYEEISPGIWRLA